MVLSTVLAKKTSLGLLITTPDGGGANVITASEAVVSTIVYSQLCKVADSFLWSLSS